MFIFFTVSIVYNVMIIVIVMLIMNKKNDANKMIMRIVLEIDFFRKILGMGKWVRAGRPSN